MFLGTQRQKKIRLTGQKFWELKYDYVKQVIIEKFTYPGQRNDVNKTFVFHFSPPKAVQENKKWH